MREREECAMRISYGKWENEEIGTLLSSVLFGLFGDLGCAKW